MILVTGGCGFIGSNFVLDWISTQNEPITVLDKLTYAGNLANLDSIKNHPYFSFFHGDINDRALIDDLLIKYRPRAILNFAAESHVDRSINNPGSFIETNINGTFTLLESCRLFWQKLNADEKNQFRFLQVSTDEVYGSLGPNDPPFSEIKAYTPNNPYSASKASADLIVNSYHHTYGLPTLITNCSNNYGPYQFPEKLIPLTILNALQGLPLFIYGDGLQIRDWLYVTDHCNGIRNVLSDAKPGTTYNIGGNCEKTNIEVVRTICSILDELTPRDSSSYASLITHIEDRPGHDRRYAIDARKIERELNWQPTENFAAGLKKTIQWYLNNLDWTANIKTNTGFQEWLDLNYKHRASA